jgi:hypothetical protein
MFDASQTLLFFEYFRVPYAVRDTWEGTRLPGPLASGLCAGARARDADRWLLWPIAADAAPKGVLASGDVVLHGAPLPARVVGADLAREWLGEGGWRPLESLRDAEGREVAAVWRDAQGSTFLPFDPAEAMVSHWSEAYAHARGVTLGARAKRLATRGYYRVRPVLPRPLQIRLRRAFSRVQARQRFPRWPLETALHDLYGLLFRLTAETAGAPVPWLAPWPRGKSWALVLTHDVETSVGYDNLHILRDVELAAGYRSSWNFVPKRYEVEDAVVDELEGQGFEIGVHGLYHDGRDLESAALLAERLPEMRAYAERWRASGFRSPATHRAWELMPMLAFDYDSSYPDTDPFEPVSGGCCTWLPFFNEDLVELPITLPQDHTLFVILQHRDGDAWFSKADALRERGGMALLITHPDYLLDEKLIDAYRRFLERFGDDETAWRALPREVSSWWRRRAASRLERVAGGWKVVGPAAGEAAIQLSTPAAAS